MMRRSALLVVLSLVSSFASAKDIDQLDKLCLSQKYHHYVTASINWYESLVEMTTKKILSSKKSPTGFCKAVASILN